MFTDNQLSFRSTPESGWGQSSVVSCDGGSGQCGIGVLDEPRTARLRTEFFGAGRPTQQKTPPCRLLLSELQGRRGKVGKQSQRRITHAVILHNIYIYIYFTIVVKTVFCTVVLPVCADSHGVRLQISVKSSYKLQKS